MANFAQPKPESESIQNIIKKIQEGDYRIPCFQRAFVWDKKKAADLIDSILKGYPIGAIILWKTKEKLFESKELGGKIIPARNESLETYYIIDGQQRLTSLYLALEHSECGEKNNFNTICICLEDDDINVLPDIPKGENQNEYITIQNLFERNYHKSIKREGKSEEYLRKAMDLDNMIRNYSVSIVTINDEYSMGEIVDIFERLNIGGKPLTLFNIISAKTYEPKTDSGPGFDLSVKHNELNKNYEKEFGAISESTLLKVISLCLIHRCNKADILGKLNKEDVISNYTNIEKALGKAVLFCKDKLGVCSSSLLPYDSQLVLIAYFFYKSEKQGINTLQEKYIIDYFWRTTVSSRFNAQADSKLNSDIVKFDSILKGTIPDQDKIIFSPKYIIENGAFKTSSSFVKGMLCLMASNSPKSLSLGRTISINKNVLSSSANKQYHHFFPLKSETILNNPGYNADNVVNIVLMDAKTNNEIKNDNPSKYIRYYQKMDSNLSDVLKTHYIVNMDDSIFEDNYPRFIEERSKLLYDAIMSRLQNTVDTVVNNNVIELVTTDEIERQNPKVGRIVHDYIFKLIQSGRVPKEEVEKLTNLQYCKERFSHSSDKNVLSYPILIEKPSNKSMKEVGCKSGHWRYYSDLIIDIYNKEYLISSQVYEENIPEFLAWYKKFYK